jgi:hypothetical protein
LANDQRGGVLRDNCRDSPFDLDGNRAIDLGDFLYLLQDILLIVPGDVNLDGVFNSSDQVSVYVKGKYESVSPNPDTCVWSEGDWNAGGASDSGGLFLVFQQCNDEQVVRATWCEIAAEIDQLFGIRCSHRLQ